MIMEATLITEPPPLRPRMNAGALRVEDAVEVHTDHLVPGGVTVFSRRLLRPADAGIGNDDVDPTKIVGRRLYGLSDLA